MRQAEGRRADVKVPLKHGWGISFLSTLKQGIRYGATLEVQSCNAPEIMRASFAAWSLMPNARV